MRRLFVIAVALGLMWALQEAHGSAQGSAGMALAAIGFVVLASFTVGDLLSSFGLPRITGYIISGIVLGPEVVGVLSQPVVAKMGVFNTLALGLIALSAGLEIELGAMRRVARTMIAITSAKVVLLLVIVGGGLYLTHLYLLPLPVSDNTKALLLVAIIAVLGTGTSPSITLAMVNETKARGRLTDITLGLAVLKDVVVIIALAVTIAIGHSAISPETSIGIAPVVLHMAQQLGLSIALGAVVGGLLILYVKYVHRELLLGAVVAVLVTAEVSAYFEFELLLVLISAGFVIRNLSEQEHHLLPALQRISLPVFVVFFTSAGAKVDLGATTSVLPFAGGAAVGRALVYYLSARFGVWVGREGSAVRKNTWFALLPQAGVTLGLVLLASHEVPELHEQILRIGLAMVAINLLIGPVLLGLALARAGEIPGRRRLQTAPTMPAVNIDALPLEAPAAVVAREIPPLADSRLVDAHAQLAKGLDAWTQKLVDEVIAPLADRGKVAIAKLITEHKQADSTAVAVRTMLETASADPSEGLERQLRAAHFEARGLAEALPERFKVVTEARLLRLNARDGAFTTTSKLLKRMARLVGLKPKRKVPVRLAARSASELRLAEALAAIVPTWFEARGDMLTELAKMVNGESDVETVKQAVVRRAGQFTEQATTDLRAAVAAVTHQLQDRLATLGGPSSPLSGLRLYEMEERVVKTLSSLDEVAVRGRQVVRARMTMLHADALYAYVAAALDDELAGMVSRPLTIVAQEVIPIIREAMRRLPANDDWQDLTASEDPLAFLSEVLEHAMDERAAAHLRGLQMKYYHATQEAKLLARLATRLEGLPAKLVVVDRHAGAPGTLLTLEPARRLEEELIEDFAPDLIAAIRPFG
ncbi:MAG TPA: cation:proton antiporter, partial [Kofleriaceae bacterium]|nr:cation:proton antiporter [Kofleriaceae bacterium]